MLTIENLSKKYVKTKYAVDHVSLEINDGEIFAFIGHNGAGKTTLIKSIIGLLDFEEGNVMLDDISIANDPVAFKQMSAYIPDNPDIYENVTGIQYLNFIASIYRLDPVKAKEEMLYYGELFEIKNQLSDLVASYSHGMKQKLVLISAIIRHPKLVLLDEPFVGLDPLAASHVKKIMREMADAGSIIFFSTHVLEVAEKLCDHVAIIKDGKIVRQGTMKEVKGDTSLEDVFLELVDHA